MVKLIIFYTAVFVSNAFALQAQELKGFSNLKINDYNLVAEKELKKRYLLSKNLPDTIKTFVDTLDLLPFRTKLEKLSFYSIPILKLKENADEFQKGSNFIDYINLESNPYNQTVSVYSNDELISSFSILEDNLNDDLNNPFFYFINLLFIHKDAPFYCNSNCDDLYSYKEGFEKNYLTFEIEKMPGTFIFKDNKVFFVKMIDNYIEKETTIPFTQRLEYLKPKLIEVNDFIINHIGTKKFNDILKKLN